MCLLEKLVDFLHGAFLALVPDTWWSIVQWVLCSEILEVERNVIEEELKQLKRDWLIQRIWSIEIQAVPFGVPLVLELAEKRYQLQELTQSLFARRIIEVVSDVMLSRKSTDCVDECVACGVPCLALSSLALVLCCRARL